MIDYTILTAYMPFAAIMQLHPGWVGFIQKRVLSCLGCLWFHRTEVCCLLNATCMPHRGVLLAAQHYMHADGCHMFSAASSAWTCS
jgi:hypothetical protein